VCQKFLQLLFYFFQVMFHCLQLLMVSCVINKASISLTLIVTSRQKKKTIKFELLIAFQFQKREL
jgi:hypothetical protein